MTQPSVAEGTVSTRITEAFDLQVRLAARRQRIVSLSIYALALLGATVWLVFVRMEVTRAKAELVQLQPKVEQARDEVIRLEQAKKAAVAERDKALDVLADRIAVLQRFPDTQVKVAEGKVARERLYLHETLPTVTKLANDNTGDDERARATTRFWELYNAELLPVESPEVEGLMVLIGQALERCGPHKCPEIRDLSFKLARQMKAEVAADNANSPGDSPPPRP